MAKKKKKKKNIFLRIIGSLLLTILIIIVLLAGVVFGVYKVKYNGDAKAMLVDISSYFLEEAKPVYVLVVGVSEDIDVELADTIMVCGYNPQAQDGFMLSIPRDTFVGKNESNARAYEKINSYYTKGIENLKEKVEEITGLQIDYYAVVKTSMLVKIVDAVGGIDFDVPIDMDYDDKTQNLHIHLEKGYQRIDGDKAEQLLRFRHNNNNTSYPHSYGDNDFGRMRTQREFIKALIEQTVRKENIFKLKELADTVFENLETNMDKEKIFSYAPYAFDMNVEDIKMEQLPGESKKINEIWFYTYYKPKTKELVEELTKSFAEDPGETTE